MFRARSTNHPGEILGPGGLSLPQESSHYINSSSSSTVLVVGEIDHYVYLYSDSGHVRV